MAPHRLWVFFLIILFLAVAVTESRAEKNDSYLHPVEGKISQQPWWEQIGDPTLKNLIKQGLAGNPGLHVAQSRIAQAKAIAFQNLTPVLPKISVELSGRETAIEQLGSNTIEQLEMAGEDVPDSYQSASAMLVGQLEVDLFAKRIMNFMGSKKDAESSLQDRDTEATALAVTIAQVYYEMMAGQDRVQAVQTQIKANENLLELVRLRYERGDATGLDVLQQKQQLAATATQLPAAQAALETSEQQLAVLLGKRPLDKVDLPSKKIPDSTTEIPTGRPSDIINNRPELKSAAASLDAAIHRKNNAILTFLPTVQIYGQAGEQASYIIENEQNFVWEAGLTLSIPIFQGGANVANYRQARAAQQLARNQYKKKSLEAIQRVESAIISEKRAKQQLEAYNLQLEAATLALQQSKQRYVLGVTEFQSVLTALNSMQQAQLNMIEARVAKINARISLLDALGGPWTQNLSEKVGSEK